MTTMFTSNNNKQQIPGPIIKCFKRLCVAWRVSVSIDFLVPVQRSQTPQPFLLSVAAAALSPLLGY